MKHHILDSPAPRAVDFRIRWAGKMSIGGALLALLSLSPLALAEPKPQPGTDDCYLALNLARTARLDTRLPEVAHDARLEDALGRVVERMINAAGKKCDQLETPGSAASDVSVIWLEEGRETCSGMMNVLIEAFVHNTPDFPPPYAEDNQMWASDLGATFHRVFGAKNTRVACASIVGCPRIWWLCKFDKQPVVGETPFSPEFYAAMLARYRAGVKFEKLTKDDLNTSLSGEKNGTSQPDKKSSSSRQDLSVVWLAVAVAFSLANFW